MDTPTSSSYQLDTSSSSSNGFKLSFSPFRGSFSPQKSTGIFVLNNADSNNNNNSDNNNRNGILSFNNNNTDINENRNGPTMVRKLHLSESEGDSGGDLNLSGLIPDVPPILNLSGFVGNDGHVSNSCVQQPDLTALACVPNPEEHVVPVQTPAETGYFGNEFQTALEYTANVDSKIVEFVEQVKNHIRMIEGTRSMVRNSSRDPSTPVIDFHSGSLPVVA